MKKILCFALAMVLLCSAVFSASAAKYIGNIEDMPEYDKHIMELLVQKYPGSFVAYPGLVDGYCESGECVYEQLYTHSVDGEVEYIMFFAYDSCNPPQPAIRYDFVGNYVTFNMYYNPYTLGFFVYVPKEDVVYTLKEAYELGINGIEKGIAEGCYFSALAGDTNVDGKVNVKDATLIQKQLADVSNPYPKEYIDKLAEGKPKGYTSHSFVIYEGVRDFDRNNKLNIKDATAIQKYIAGIVEE